MVVEERTADLLKLIERGDLDLALMSLPILNKGFEKEILFKEELLLAMPSKHPLASKKKIKLIAGERQFISCRGRVRNGRISSGDDCLAFSLHTLRSRDHTSYTSRFSRFAAPPSDRFWSRGALETSRQPGRLLRESLSQSGMSKGPSLTLRKADG
jgi:hypothetical protein